jgi:hypothetical protein
MNPAKAAELLDVLKAACMRQFRFNPRRVEAGMRYKGVEGTGNALVHVFRDSHTHSQIILKGTMATLREQHADATHKDHWSDAEKARYCHTDAEIDAEIAAKKAELDFIKASALYQDHREQLLSHYKDWPSYAAGKPTAKEAARALLAQLSVAEDSRFTAFSSHLKITEIEALTHALLAPCHLEIEAHLANQK